MIWRFKENSYQNTNGILTETEKYDLTFVWYQGNLKQVITFPAFKIYHKTKVIEEYGIRIKIDI